MSSFRQSPISQRALRLMLDSAMRAVDEAAKATPRDKTTRRPQLGSSVQG